MKPDQFQELSNFFAARIILTAAELDIFPILQSPLRADEVAQKCGNINAEATERLLDALTGIGTLVKESGTYSIIPELKESLGTDKKSILPMLHHRANLWKSWSHLTEVVRRGQGCSSSQPDEPQSIERIHKFSRAMAVAASGITSDTIEQIDLNNVERILDIGGGPGVYAAEFKSRKQDAEVFVLDIPGVDDIIRERTEGTPLEGKIGFIPGNALEISDADVIGSDEKRKFDIIFMSNLIHSMSPNDIKNLFSRSKKWLRKNGRIIVKEFFLDDSRTKPPRAAIFAINMLINTDSGNSYSWTEVEDWLRPLSNSTSRIHLSDGVSGMIVAYID